jgi:hypothetical protein
MSVFSLMIVGGHGLGPTIGGWVEFYEALQWRWIGWIQMMYVSFLRPSLPVLLAQVEALVAFAKTKKSNSTLHRICAVCLVLLPFMQETRASVILTRIARKKRQESGDTRYRTLAEVERVGLAERIWISCTRPLRTFTPPIPQISS